MVIRDKLIATLHQGPKTIPEIAEALGYPRREVVFWVMGLWRYGMLEPQGEADAHGYYRYRLIREQTASV
jgi:hypothetical protein